MQSLRHTEEQLNENDQAVESSAKSTQDMCLPSEHGAAPSDLLHQASADSRREQSKAEGIMARSHTREPSQPQGGLGSAERAAATLFDPSRQSDSNISDTAVSVLRECREAEPHSVDSKSQHLEDMDSNLGASIKPRSRLTAQTPDAMSLLKATVKTVTSLGHSFSSAEVFLFESLYHNLT